MTTVADAPREDATLSTEDWLRVARETLIREGIEGVKIDRLAKACGVTRGGFYWRFHNRTDLLDQLLAHWRKHNSQPMLDRLAAPGTPAERLQRLFDLWLEETEFSPDYDTAVRNWAKGAPDVAAVVREVDDTRIEAIKTIFLAAGYGDDEALVRARVTYFHQVGYYAMGVTETLPRRASYRDLYFRILSGFDDESEAGKHRR